MKGFSAPVRWKIGSQFCRLFLFTAVLVTVLLLPRPALAQERQLDLFMRLVPHRYPIEATAGKDNSFSLEINNRSTEAITDLQLSSDEPEGWVIDFDPSSIDRLAPGSLYTVNVNIRPPRNAGRGEYEINFIAEASDIRKVEKAWVTVKLAVKWVWAGVGGILAVVIAFVLIFLRFGRQKSGT